MNKFTYSLDQSLIEQKILSIYSFINANIREIISGIHPESVAVYEFLQKEYKKGKLIDNYLFQFIFSSYYRLNNAGLSDEFKQKFFEYFDQLRNKKLPAIKDVLLELYQIKNKKGYSVQFSFVTKLYHTINQQYPIYDREVAFLFDFKQPYGVKDYTQKINRYLLQYNELHYSFQQLLKEGMMEEEIKLFKNHFIKYNIPAPKVIDFIFWRAGKMKRESKI